MKLAVVWFRNALRIHDNPVLSWAYESENADFILPIYIFEEEIQKKTKKPNPDVLAVYDVNAPGWRSFRWDSVTDFNAEFNG